MPKELSPEEILKSWEKHSKKCRKAGCIYKKFLEIVTELRKMIQEEVLWKVVFKLHEVVKDAETIERPDPLFNVKIHIFAPPLIIDIEFVDDNFGAAVDGE